MLFWPWSIFHLSHVYYCNVWSGEKYVFMYTSIFGLKTFFQLGFILVLLLLRNLQVIHCEKKLFLFIDTNSINTVTKNCQWSSYRCFQLVPSHVNAKASLPKLGKFYFRWLCEISQMAQRYFKCNLYRCVWMASFYWNSWCASINRISMAHNGLILLPQMEQLRCH